MDYRVATSKDLANIFRSLAPRLAVEYERAGVGVRSAKDAFLEAIRNGRANTLVADNEPVAIIAWSIVERVIRTSFAAKEEFFLPQHSRFSAMHIRAIQEENDGLPVCARSYSLHPGVPKWFKVLGFEIGDSAEKHTDYWLRSQIRPAE